MMCDGHTFVLKPPFSPSQSIHACLSLVGNCFEKAWNCVAWETMEWSRLVQLSMHECWKRQNLLVHISYICHMFRESRCGSDALGCHNLVGFPCKISYSGGFANAIVILPHVPESTL